MNQTLPANRAPARRSLRPDRGRSARRALNHKPSAHSPVTRLGRLRRLSRTLFVVGLLVCPVALSCSTEATRTTMTEGSIVVKPVDGDHADADAESSAADDGSELSTKSANLQADLEAAPIADFVWFDGSPGSSADFAGSATVLNFWGSYCPPCIAEMPEFESVHQRLGDKVAFVGMNVADDRSRAEHLAERTGVTYPLAEDIDGRVFAAFGGFVMPTTVLLTAENDVAYVWAGTLTGDELQALISEHLDIGALR